MKFLLLILAALWFSPQLNAQTNRQRSGEFLGRDLAGNGRFQAYERVLRVLTEDQRASLRDAVSAQREKMRSLEQKVAELRREIFESALIDKFDEQAIRKKMMEAAKLETDLSMIRLKAFSEMQPPLSAKQLEEIRTSRETGSATAGAPSKTPKRPEIPRDENGLPLKDRATPKQ